MKRIALALLSISLLLTSSLAFAQTSDNERSSSTEEQHTAYIEVLPGDLSNDILTRITQEGATIKQAFMTYCEEGYRLYKLFVYSCDLQEATIYITENGRIVNEIYFP